MKTSLEIDDELYRAARIHAARERTTVRALVERGLAIVLGHEPAASPAAPSDRDREDLDALCAQISGLPLLTDATPDQILGYDESGGFG